jgi:hypothetical protein
MGWPLRRVEWKTPYSDLQPGDWWTRPLADVVDDDDLSPELRASGRRETFWIRLPGNCGSWCPDLNEAGGTSAWTLTLADDGSPLTATPSINAVGCYHGWLTNGVLTDDCEGRTFP